MYIGIDFGTTYSTLTIYHGEELVPPLFEDRGVPTRMRYDSFAREWLYGENNETLLRYPQDTIRNLKSKIRNGGDIMATATSAGYKLHYKDLLQNYLTWLIKEGINRAREHGYIDEDELPQGITVTVPCGFAGRGMGRSGYGQAIKEGVISAYGEVIRSGIAAAAGTDCTVRIVEEPVAAAVDYLMSRQGDRALAENSKMTILVADLGGGTFDVTAMKCDGRNKFTVIAKEGDLHLGGNNFDEELLNLIVNKLNEQNSEYSLSESDRQLELLRVTAIKERLSKTDKQGFVSQNSTVPPVIVTRQEFENATSGLLKRIQAVITKCVDKSGGIDRIDKIVLVGGACRMPQIKNGIKSLYQGFHEKDIIIYNPSYAIANGAAHCAAMRGGVTVTDLGDIATCTYGFRSGPEGDQKICNMIFSGEQFEAGGRIERWEHNFNALESDQKTVCYKVFESLCEKGKYRVPYEGNEAQFNPNGLSVSVPVPEKYLTDPVTYPNGARDYKMDPKLILTSDNTLRIEIYHDGVLVGSNQVTLK